MNEDFGNWNELAKLWRAEGAAVAAEDVEREARREQARMRALAIAEAVGLAVACLAALWLVLSMRYTTCRRSALRWVSSPGSSRIACAGIRSPRGEKTC